MANRMRIITTFTPIAIIDSRQIIISNSTYFFSLPDFRIPKPQLTKQTVGINDIEKEGIQ